MTKSAHKNVVVNRAPNVWFCSFVSTGKELDEETGYGYFGARYMDHELMTGWLSVDPMADKYPSLSPYNYCAWNPMKLVDPDGMDTVNISYNQKESKWQIDKVVEHSGNDIFNVVDAKGATTTTTFDKGNHGSRICVLNIEETNNCTLGVYHLSGDDSDLSTGFVATPKGASSLISGSHAHLPDGVYPLSYNNNTSLKWLQPIVYDQRDIKIHPTGNSTATWSDVEQWTTGCYIVGGKTYRVDAGRVKFSPNDSRSRSQYINEYLGATRHYKNIGYRDYPGSIFGNGIKKGAVLIQKGGVF